MESMSLERAIREYLQNLKERNYSIDTINGYRNYLKYFCEWIFEQRKRNVEEIEEEDLINYRRHIEECRRKDTGGDLSDGSKALRLSPVMRMFFYLSKRKIVEENPAKEIKRFQIRNKQKQKTFEEEEVERILEGIDVDSRYGIRDRAMLETLYSTGIRRMEIQNLDLYDIDMVQGMLKIRQGKGKKDRIVPIGNRAMKWIEIYLKSARPYLIRDKGERSLFLNRVGDRLSRGRIAGIVNGHIKQSTGSSGGCHQFRHTAATLMLKHGAGVGYIQQLLGHQHISTTQIYTKINYKDLQREYLKAHPGDREGLEF